MNYLKVYCNLIRKAENRTPPEGYTEKHHIFPKSIFGKNKRVVSLTAREHYIAHALLEKIYIKRYGKDDDRTKKMTYAFWGMNNQKKDKRYFSSHLYETSKQRFIELLSENQKGKNNSMYGKIGEECPFYRQQHTEESKQKMSKKLKEKWKNQKHPWIGRNHSEESKAKISAANRNISEETRAKMSEAQKDKVISKETKAKMSASSKGKTHSDESKAKISSAQKGKVISKETKAKISASMKGKTHSEETKAKMSASSKGKTHSDESKAKMSEAQKGKVTSEETKAKMRESHRKRRLKEEI
jgi:hypothetical protein